MLGPRIFLTGLLLLLSVDARGANGLTYVDPTFAPALTAPPGQLRAWLQPDQKIILSGDRMRSVNGVVTPRVVRLNPDGALDPTFRARGDFWAPWALGFVGDKMVTASAWRIRRLNADGSPDDAFYAEAKNLISGWQAVYHLRALPDGSVFVPASIMNDTSGGPVFKLTPTGAIDRTFKGTNNSPLARQPDGKLIAATWIALNQFSAAAKLVRMDADGNLDPTFNSPIATNTAGSASYFRAALQPDSKILAIGFFTAVGEHPRNRIARFNTDGSLDQSFDPGAGPSIEYPPAQIASVGAAADGKIYVSGLFDAFDGKPRANIARLLPDGSLDATFVPATISTNPIIPLSLQLQADGKLVIAQDFPMSVVVEGLIARLNADGSRDESFAPLPGGPATISAVLVTTNRIYISGDFRHVNGVARRSLVALTHDGKLDPTFASVQMDTAPLALLETADGKLLLGGGFTEINGWRLRGLARLHADGSPDTNFTRTLMPESISALAVDADGKVLAAGAWRGAITVTRILSSGAIDREFPIRARTHITSIVPLPDQKMFLTGDTFIAPGQTRDGIARVNADGTLDSTFMAAIGLVASTEVRSRVQSMAILPDGKLLLSGSMTNTAFRNQSLALLRLNENGSLDTSFTPITYDHDRYRDPQTEFTILPDGRILLCGDFKKLNGATHVGLARVHVNGALDTNFDMALYGNVRKLRLAPTGAVIASGFFDEVDGMSRTSLMRILPEPAAHPDGRVLMLLPGRFESIPFMQTTGFQMLVKGMSHHRVSIYASTNLIDWIGADSTSPNADQEDLVTIYSLSPADPQRYFRAEEQP